MSIVKKRALSRKKPSQGKSNQFGSSIVQVVQSILKSIKSLVADKWATACAHHLYTKIVSGDVSRCPEMSGDVCRSFLNSYFDSEHALCPAE